MLHAQRIYAPESGVSVGEGPLALGRSLHSLLPEDRFDRGPLAWGDQFLVADVRLDDREALARAIGIDSARLSDVAIVGAALQHWGEDAIPRLYGDWALAWWDGRRLHLARDPGGQRPLHYHRSADFFAFASMPKGLHVLPEIPRGPDAQALAEFLLLLPEKESRSFFEGVERVVPGHVCTVTASGVTSTRWWNPSPASLRLASSAAYEEALREATDRAVATRLRGADRHVAAHLSGGLDSGIVAATAARLLAPEGRVAAFTAVPVPGTAAQRHVIVDESALAATVAARHANIDHHLVRAGDRSPTEPLDRNFHLFERPLLNLCNDSWMTAILDAAREGGHHVLLTGQSGNTTLSYAGMEALPDWLASGRLLDLARTAWALHRRGRVRWGTIAAQTLGPFLPGSAWRRIRSIARDDAGPGDTTLLHPDRFAALAPVAAARALDPHYRPRRDPVASRLWSLGRVDHGNHNKGMLAGWGIDVRDPTADRALVELCLAIPVEQFLADGIPRRLARRAFADRLSPEVATATTRGLQGADWHRGLVAHAADAQQETARLLQAPGARDLLDAPAMEHLVAGLSTADWTDPATQRRYRLALLRGMSAGHFLRKASGSNA
jgi:asparagine synthase (glutamine-hydrolysing)